VDARLIASLAGALERVLTFAAAASDHLLACGCFALTRQRRLLDSMLASRLSTGCEGLMTIQRPIPIRADPQALHTDNVRSLVRAAAAHLRAHVNKSTPERAAEQMFGRDLATLEVIKAASSPATMSGASSAPP